MNNVNTTARAELYESGIDPSSFISKGVRIFWADIDQFGAR